MQANTLWPINFMADALRFRTFNVLDKGVCEALATEIDARLSTERVTRALEQLKEWCSLTQAIHCDNAPEYTAQSLVEWCRKHHVELRYIQNQNAYIEIYRTEGLDARLIGNPEQVRHITDLWLQSYNEERLHKSLGNLPPSVFRQQCERANSPLKLST